MPIQNEDQNQFKPGQSGNPGGRPKGPITQFLRLYGSADSLEFTVTKTKGDKKESETVTLATDGTLCINQVIAAKLLHMAATGDLKAIKEVLNRTEGRVPQPINLGGQEGNPLQVLLTGGGGGRMGNIPTQERPSGEAPF